MTAKDASSTTHQKTGRRPQGKIGSPRDKTVCFLVSEEEKAAVDALGLATNLTRSAILAQIVTLFLNCVDSQAEHKKAERELLSFIKEGRSKIDNAPEWVKSISQKSKPKNKE